MAILSIMLFFGGLFLAIFSSFHDDAAIYILTGITLMLFGLVIALAICVDRLDERISELENEAESGKGKKGYSASSIEHDV